MKKFKIGNLYSFEYSKGFVPQPKKLINDTRILLNMSQQLSLSNRLMKSKDKIEENFKERKIEVLKFVKLKKQLDKLIAKKKKNKTLTTHDEFLVTLLTKEIKTQNKKLFNSRKNTSLKSEAENLFIRNYKPEAMNNIGTSDLFDSEPHKVHAVFAGNNITQTGKITYKWYLFDSTFVEKKRTVGLEKYLEIG